MHNYRSSRPHSGTSLSHLCAAFVLLTGLLASSAHADNEWGAQNTPDAGCLSTDAWFAQENPASEPTGTRNVAYPESNATYWGMIISGPIGSSLTFKGQFPASRYMGLQAYDSLHHVLGAIDDQSIIPDAGTNNPFQLNAGPDQGSYTVTMTFGTAPASVPANTFYTGGLTEVMVLYRVYYANNPADLTGGTSNPVLPTVYQNGVALNTCAPRPILPTSATVNGHIDQYDFTGAAPATAGAIPTPRPFLWMAVTDSSTNYYPSANNNYISAQITRKFLSPPYKYNMVVMRMRAPTHPNTQAGEQPWLAQTERQVRYWSVCTDDMLSTGVARCTPDNKAPLVNGYATFVISDPDYKPDDATLAKWGATWMPFGALLPTDIVYDVYGTALSAADGAYYNGLILYRQTMANPSWQQSMASVGKYEPPLWPKMMGDYWPSIDYCSAVDFSIKGARCISTQRK